MVKVAIIGRVNVGKSTLFNALVGSSVSISWGEPATTRDVVEAIGHSKKRDYLFLDTAGYFPEKSTLQKLMEEQTERAIEKADILIAVFDVNSGITEIDWEIRNKVMRSGKPYIFVVNKVDSKNKEIMALSEFHKLGDEFIVVSALHKKGLEELLEKIDELADEIEKRKEVEGKGTERKSDFITQEELEVQKYLGTESLKKIERELEKRREKEIERESEKIISRFFGSSSEDENENKYDTESRREKFNLLSGELGEESGKVEEGGGEEKGEGSEAEGIEEKEEKEKEMKYENMQMEEEGLEEEEYFENLGVEEFSEFESVWGDTQELEPEKILEREEEEEEKKREKKEKTQKRVSVRVSIVGRPNVGKSSLVNAILGYPRCIVYDEPGTTRDAVRVPFDFDGMRFILVDTPGIRRKSRIEENTIEFKSVGRSLTAIFVSDVCILVIDSVEGITHQDKHIASLVERRGRALVVALNKIDIIKELKPAGGIGKIVSALKTSMKFLSWAYFIPVSAKTRYGIPNLLRAVHLSWESWTKRLKPSELLRIREMIKGLDFMRGQNPKIFQVGIKPPTFLVYVNEPENLRRHQIMHISKIIRKLYGFYGTPIHFRVKRHGEKY